MRNYQNIVKDVKKLVWQKLKNEFSGHDYWHCQRVAKLVLKIGKEEKADLQTLELAAWLHDIGVIKGRKNHEIRSARQAAKILKKFMSQEKINKIISCIRNHRFTTGKIETQEDRILQDADKLDVIGVIGIGRIFSFAGRYKRTIYDGKLNPQPERYKKTGRSRTMIEHYFEKIFLLPNLLHTKKAKIIGNNRIKFTKVFIKRFLSEWEGKK